MSTQTEETLKQMAYRLGMPALIGVPTHRLKYGFKLKCEVCGKRAHVRIRIIKNNRETVMRHYCSRFCFELALANIKDYDL